MSDREQNSTLGAAVARGPPKGRETGRRPPFRERGGSGEGPVILYGWHTVVAALANPQRHIRKLMLTENAARRLADENIEIPLTPEIVRPALIDARLGPDALHQGLLAEADPLPSPDIDTLPQGGDRCAGARPDHRPAQCRRHPALGGSLRGQGDRHHGAALAGGDRGAGEMGLRRAGAGAAGDGRIWRGADRNERAAFLTVGLDSQGSENLGRVTLRQPLALVLGAEGRGLRGLTRETCAVVARLDTPGEIKSLNVSNAAVLALYIGASRLGLMG